MTLKAYSYRVDPAVPDFDDSRPLFVFDGVCVLCSSGASFLMRHDREAIIAFTSAQAPLGQALYRHYELNMDETYLFVANGHAHAKSAGYLALAMELGGIWRVAELAHIVPEVLRDRFYDIIARNRYDWFGKTGESCRLLTPEQRERLL